MKLNKGQIDTLNILTTRGKTEYWNLDAAVLKTQIGESNLRAFLRGLDIEVEGVTVFWDEETSQSGEFDFGISVCDAHFHKLLPHQARPICTCPDTSETIRDEYDNIIIAASECE